MTRYLMIVSLCLLACGSTPNSTTDQGSPSDGGGGAVDMPAGTCTRTCGTCAVGESCFVPNGTQTFQAFCARPCGVTSDCPAADQKCIQVFNEVSKSPVCVSRTRPLLCENATFNASFHCDFPPDGCKSAAVLQHGVSFVENQLCGTEYVFCPGGCVPADADAGTAAHCQ